jgi:hypothetical protein
LENCETWTGSSRTGLTNRVLEKGSCLQKFGRLEFPLYGIELGKKSYPLGVRGILVISDLDKKFQSERSKSKAKLQSTGFEFKVVQMTPRNHKIIKNPKPPISKTKVLTQNFLVNFGQNGDWVLFLSHHGRV